MNGHEGPSFSSDSGPEELRPPASAEEFLASLGLGAWEDEEEQQAPADEEKIASMEAATSEEESPTEPPQQEDKPSRHPSEEPEEYEVKWDRLPSERPQVGNEPSPNSRVPGKEDIPTRIANRPPIDERPTWLRKGRQTFYE